MTELIGSNQDITKERNIEESKEHKKNVDNGVTILEENSEKQQQRNIEERTDETFGDLDGKKFKEGDIIKFMYMGEKGEKKECTFNVGNQTIEYNGIIYEIKMPKGANLDSLEFKNGEVNIVGSVGWFSGEGKTSNIELYKALEKVFNYGYVEIATGDGESLKINKKG